MKEGFREVYSENSWTKLETWLERKSNEVFELLKDKNKVEKEIFIELFEEYFAKLSPEVQKLFEKIQEKDVFKEKLDSIFVLATLLFKENNIIFP